MKTKKNTSAKLTYNLPLLFMAAPGLVLLIMFSYVPLFGLVLAFKDYVPRDGIFGSAWVGLKNFGMIFRDGEVWNVLKNTIFYHFTYEITIFVIAIALAIMLFNVKSKKAARIYQVGIQTPYLVSMVALGAITYIFLRADSGLLNMVLKKMGAEPIAWYNEGKYWPFILVAINTWFGAGIRTIYFYSALMGIDSALFEAADVDGARWYHKVFKIMIPSMAPTISILAILSLGNLLASNFALTYAVTRNSPALYQATDVISIYAYRGLVSQEYGLTTALEMVTGLASAIGIIVTNLFVKKINPENSLF